MIIVELTDIAAQKLKELMLKENKPALKISVQGGGCSGLSYKLAMSDMSHIGEHDMKWESKSCLLYTDKKSVLYLTGTIMDFSDGLNGKGFEFINPNANRTCACGESFGV